MAEQLGKSIIASEVRKLFATVYIQKLTETGMQL